MKSKLRPAHLWLGIATIAAFDGFMATVTEPHLSRLSGGKRMFDLRFAGYSSSQAAAYLERLGEAGRAYYAHVFLPIDSLFALLEGAALTALAVWFTSARRNAFFSKRPRLRILIILLPGAAALLDLLENGAIALMLGEWPLLNEPVRRLASFATQAKWIFALISLAAIAALAAASLRQAKWRR
jgi:hypothetical protein